MGGVKIIFLLRNTLDSTVFALRFVEQPFGPFGLKAGGAETLLVDA